MKAHDDSDLIRGTPKLATNQDDTKDFYSSGGTMEQYVKQAARYGDIESWIDTAADSSDDKPADIESWIDTAADLWRLG